MDEWGGGKGEKNQKRRGQRAFIKNDDETINRDYVLHVVNNVHYEDVQQKEEVENCSVNVAQ